MLNAVYRTHVSFDCCVCRKLFDINTSVESSETRGCDGSGRADSKNSLCEWDRNFIKQGVWPRCAHTICNSCFTDIVRKAVAAHPQYPKCPQCGLNYDPSLVGRIFGRDSLLSLSEEETLTIVAKNSALEARCLDVGCLGFKYPKQKNTGVPGKGDWIERLQNIRCLVCRKESCFVCYTMHDLLADGSSSCPKLSQGSTDVSSMWDN